MATPLADRACVPCRGGTPPLDGEQIAPLLTELPGWTVEGGRLTRSFRFPNWLQAVAFVNAISAVAEAERHHPDLLLRWGEVRATIWTHAIDGLTESDFVLAAKLDRLTTRAPA